MGGSIHDIENQATLNHAHRDSNVDDVRLRESGLLVVGLLSALLLPAVLLPSVLPVTMCLRHITVQLPVRRLCHRQLRIRCLQRITDTVRRLRVSVVSASTDVTGGSRSHCGCQSQCAKTVQFQSPRRGTTGAAASRTRGREQSTANIGRTGTSSCRKTAPNDAGCPADDGQCSRLSDDITLLSAMTAVSDTQC